MSIDIAPGGERLPEGQRPILPGSPGSPPHPLKRRFVYGLVGVIIGLTGGLGNALVMVNLAQLQGSLGLYGSEINWLPTAYAMTYVCSSLLLIKLRIEFGLRPFALIFTGLYALITFAHLLVGGFVTAVMVRAASGVASAALFSLTIYYIMQAAPASWRLKSVALGLGVSQLAIPLARLFSTELLSLGEWRALYAFELGLALISFAAVLVLPLPPSERAKTFEPLDGLTFLLLTAGFGLLCAALGLGRALWWTDAPWIGWALAASLPLIVGALLIEHHRTRPLLATRWLASGDILRFIVVTVMLKIASAEQSSGVVGLLNTLGLNNDQLHPLFLIILLATAAGSIASGIVMSPTYTTPPIILAIGLAAVGSFLDIGATNLSRPEQFYFTQALVAFASALFLAPSLLFGLGQALTRGQRHIISFVGLFGLIQTVGGLGGSALLNTFEVVREKTHSNALVQHLVLTDPLVAARVQQGGALVAATQADPALQSASGVALLAQQATVEAHVLAYNDVFMLVGVLATVTTTYLGVAMLHRRRRERRRANQARQ